MTSEPPSATSPTDHDPLAGLGEALATVGDRWSLLLVAGLLDGPRRYGELLQALAGIAPNVLAQRLRHLEQRGLVLAQPYSDRPPRYLYELTGAGRELAGALRMLSDWGARRTGGDGGHAQHPACGTELEARWYCPACEEAVPGPPGMGSAEHERAQLFYA